MDPDGLVLFCEYLQNHKNKGDTRLAKLEDDFSNVTCKEINRPSISHKLCEIVLMIDEHDRMRQNNLVLERKWLTKDFCFRLLTNESGLSDVDMHWWCMSTKFKRVSANLA